MATLARYIAAEERGPLTCYVHLVNLPKPESPEHVRTAVAAIDRAERANGVDKPVGLLLNIETPAALRNAAALALADARVAGLQLGLGDLFEPLGIFRRDTAAVGQAMFATRIAAGEAGIYAYDSAFADIRDESAVRAALRGGIPISTLPLPVRNEPEVIRAYLGETAEDAHAGAA